MNRANFGNQITNGMQIMSVAGTTGAGFINASNQRRINDLSSGLNNLSDSELAQVGQMRADQLKQQISEFYNPPEPVEKNETFNQKVKRLTSGYDKLSDEELNKLGDIKAAEYRKKISDFNKPKTVDEILSDNDLNLKENSTQIKSIKTKISNDVEYFKDRQARIDFYNQNIKNKNVISNKVKGQIKKIFERGDK